MYKKKAARLACWLVLFAGGILNSAWAAEAAVPASAGASVPASGTTNRLESYHLLALSPSEGVAVLRDARRRLVTLRVGSPLPFAHSRLVEVLADRARFETVDDQGRRQIAWMIRPADPEQLPQVQRVGGTPPVQPAATSKAPPTVTPLSAPATTSKK